MKRKINLLLFAAGMFLKSNAQVVFYEGFTSPFNPSANGWNVQNLSSPVGTSSWFQGIAATFPALSGGSTDYFACNYNSTSTAGVTNTISTWLITPTLNLVNGALIEFATRVPNTNIPDRMQVYFSTAGSGTNVGTSAGTATNSAGTFTNIIRDINPTLNGNFGYPKRWSVYTATISGLTAPIVGRIAFRYYVPNGGLATPNSNFVGIDEFRYSMPCAYPNISFSQQLINACAGDTNRLSGGFGNTTGPITSYTWYTAPNSSSPSYTIPHISYPGTTPGVTSSSTIVTPTVSSVYYYLAETTPGCIRMAISSPVEVNPSPTVTVVQTPSNVCSGSNFTLASTGASTYTYLIGTNSFTSNPLNAQVSSVSSLTTVQFTVIGRNTSGCRSSQILPFVINPNPTVSVVISKSVTCVKNPVTLTPEGASGYIWSGAVSSSLSILTYSTITAGVKQFTLVGVSQEGCKSLEVVTSLTVNSCTGINEEMNNITSLRVYPNPFVNKLHLSEFKGTVEIYNQLGQKVFSYIGDALKTIDTSSLSSGVYILRVNDELGDQKYFRLVKG